MDNACRPSRRPGIAIRCGFGSAIPTRGVANPHPCDWRARPPISATALSNTLLAIRTECGRFDGDVLKVAYGSREVPQSLDIVLLRRPSRTDIYGNVFGRCLQPVQRVAEMLPAAATDKDLIRTQVASFRLTASLVGTLSVGSAAVALRTARAGSVGEGSPAPGAVADSFCHCDGTLPGTPELAEDHTSRCSIR